MSILESKHLWSMEQMGRQWDEEGSRRPYLCCSIYVMSTVHCTAIFQPKRIFGIGSRSGGLKIE